MTGREGTSQPSVLLAFRGENLRSFREEFDFSMLATSVAEESCVRQIPWRAEGSPVEVLPVAGVFGANASGKSNLLRVMDDMRRFVVQSFRHFAPGGGFPRRPFLLDPDALSAPSRFEVDVVVEGVRHEYGFVVDDSGVLEEWAYRYPKGRAALIFHRDGADVTPGTVEKGRTRAVAKLLRPNALFLSTAASANHALLSPLYSWFERNLLLAQADTREARQALTSEMLRDNHFRNRAQALLRAADLGVESARRRAMDPEIQERMRRALMILRGAEDDAVDVGDVDFEDLGVELEHRARDGSVIPLPMRDESLGTLVWFGVVGPVLQVLDSGSVLLADELDSSLHPALGAELIRLFQDPQTNPNHAQLVFNSHDSSLLGDTVATRLIGRDQVWFTEKDRDGETRLYPLLDLSPRKQEAIGKRYLDGRYGATPIVSHAEFAAAVSASESVHD